ARGPRPQTPRANSSAGPNPPGRSGKNPGAALFTHDDDIRGAAGEQAHADHAGDLVELALHRHRVGDHEAVDVQHPVAVVGGHALPPHGLAAGAGEDFAGDQAAGHGDHLDREREAAEDVDLLGRIDDADEGLAGLGDDLLPRQRGAAALDQAPVRVALVGAVDVQRQRADGVQVEDVDAVGFQARGALLGTGYRAFDAILD